MHFFSFWKRLEDGFVAREASDSAKRGRQRCEFLARVWYEKKTLKLCSYRCLLRLREQFRKPSIERRSKSCVVVWKFVSGLRQKSLFLRTTFEARHFTLRSK